MPVIRYYASKHKREFIKGYLAFLQEWGEDFAFQLEKIIEEVIAQTFRFATSFGSTGASNLASPGGLQDARVKTNKIVTTNRRGLLIELHALVIDPSGSPHLIWHVLSQGRKPYIFPHGKVSPPIRKRKGKRTAPGQLKVSAFPGFVGDETYVIHGGTLVAGIPARNWYAAAVKEFRGRVKALPNTSHMEIRRSVIKDVRA